MTKMTKEQKAVKDLKAIVEKMGIDPEVFAQAVEVSNTKGEKAKKTETKKANSFKINQVKENGTDGASNVFITADPAEVKEIVSNMKVPVYMISDACDSYQKVKDGVPVDSKKVYNTATTHGWKSADVTLPNGAIHSFRTSFNSVLTRDPVDEEVKGSGKLDIASLSIEDINALPAEVKNALLEKLIATS